MINASTWAPAPGVGARTAIAAIQAYQRYLSPYKGYRCAHRLHHGGESCSQYVKREIEEEGLVGIRAKAAARFAECREAGLAMKAEGIPFAATGWLASLHPAILTGTYCIPLPGGCCLVHS